MKNARRYTDPQDGDAVDRDARRSVAVKVHNETCSVHEYFRRIFLSCYDQYSEASEDKAPFGPGTGTAWTYHEASVTKSLPYWGKVATYGGGGYYADFTLQKSTTANLIKDLKDNLWITRGTRAVFVDFSVYNANENLFSVCNYVDWTIIVGLTVQTTLAVKRRIEIVPVLKSLGENSHQYGNIEYFAYIKTEANNIFVVTLFVAYVKVFKFLNFNRTMGQLNNTLRKSAMDILGFSLMFFIIYFAFAEVGYLLFGSQVEHYSSFGTAMFALLRTILGDFNYAEIEQANRILAPIYFLAYIFLVFFVLLNMFLAIINDSYADVKTEIAIAPDEMQMTEYISRGFFNMMRKMGCVSGETAEVKRELNVTMRKIRDALTKYILE
ncbi:hypothetical protein NQ318_018199 [Aromia moschata]|uniref:Polycystin cation channel PKD1/PKD2 domain-containing protein n=1 Tax=Aromia moschata TaxID=1265417 RepID=A0AAV8ZFS9_9CUCU|nr:hypothetical protein NQ318_018199 [Aromia moschata]